jgi:hypothetical protein
LSAESEAATGVRASRRVRLNASAKWLEPHSTRLVIPSLRLAAHPRLVPRARRCQTIGPPSNCRALEPSAPSAYTPSSPFTAPDEHLDAPLRGRTQRCFAEKLWQVLIYGPRARTPRQGVRSRLRLRPPQDGLRPWLSVGGEQALRITSLQPSPAMRSRCNAARVPWSIHKPTPSSLPS